jgi:uncharacterized protein YceH (UPF0502 family)
MSFIDLSAVECRVLGCLLEKERVTPENYPLSLNGLTAACNQSTNRDPVTSYDEKTVEEAVQSLRDRRLVTMIAVAGARVQKFKHRLNEHYKLEEHEIAILCVLLLRGPQTPGELRIRTERMHAFGSLVAVEETLDVLAREGLELVQAIPARPGQKEGRYRCTFGVESAAAEPAAPDEPILPSRLEVLHSEVKDLRDEVARLKDEFQQFRRQFE